MHFDTGDVIKRGDAVMSIGQNVIQHTNPHWGIHTKGWRSNVIRANYDSN